jgi:acyl-CoA thioesterase FadM
MAHAMWGASISLAWLWGLGFFFSIHFAFLHGLAGLLLFAVPNALGLVFFGMALDRRARSAALRGYAESVIRRYPLMFVSYQVTAVALTLFSVAKYCLAPIGVPAPLVLAAFLLFAAGVYADRLGLRSVVKLHCLAYPAFLLAAGLLAAGMPDEVRTAAALEPDAEFWAMTIPLLLGLLFGPWLDLQQWQRAVAVAEAGLSVARAFVLGGVMFLVLLLAVGTLALTIPPELSAYALPSAFDRELHAEAALATAVVGSGTSQSIALLATLVFIAALSTLDSSRLAFRWFADTVAAGSDTLLMSLVPKSAREALFPYAALSLLAAGAGYGIGAELEHYMILFATLFLAYSAGLAQEAWSGTQASSEALTFGLGASSLCLLTVGVLGEAPAVIAIAPLIALSSPVLHARNGAAAGTSDDAAEATPQLQEVPALVVPAAERDLAPAGEPMRSVTVSLARAPSAPAAQSELGFGPGGFVDGWFCLRIISTYADTNSVGNVYFASYALWVGKTRELCFRTAMPDFDLKTTRWLILTRQFQHKYLREMREFDEVTCRVRAAGFDKRFVEIRHEIRDRSNQLVGIGSQTLMFVDSISYRPIDIPLDFVDAFKPYL